MKNLLTRYKWHLIVLGIGFIVTVIFSLVNSNRRLNREFERLNEQRIRELAVISLMESELKSVKELNNLYEQRMILLEEHLKDFKNQLSLINNQKHEAVKKVPSMSNADLQRWFDERYPRTGN